MKKKYYLILFFLFTKTIYAQDPFIGEIRLFATNFAPTGWMACEGQILKISTNTALFSLLGVRYGGDGRTTFGLPDLRNVMAVGTGQGQGLTAIELGNQIEENKTLTTVNLPSHTHTVPIKVSAAVGNSSVPGPTVSLAAPVQIFNENSRPVKAYNSTTTDITLANNPTSSTGGYDGLNRQPVLSGTYCIAIQGIFPPRQ